MLMVFVGAGVSADSGAPLFNDLRDAMVSANLPRFYRKRFQPEQTAKFAPEQLFYQAGRTHGDRRALSRFVTDCFSRLRPNQNHHLLASVLRSGIVWTTNYDILIEKAARSVVDVRPVIRSNAHFSEHHHGAGVLFKPHGSLDQNRPGRPRALLFTTADVMRPVPEEWKSSLIRSAAGNDVLVWGYAGNDPDMMPLLRKAMRNATSVTWMTATPGDVKRLSAQLPDVTVTFPGNGTWSHEELRVWLRTHYLRRHGVAVPPETPAPSSKHRRRARAPRLSLVPRANITSGALPNGVGPILARRMLLRGALLRPSRELVFRWLRSHFVDTANAASWYLRIVQLVPKVLQPRGGYLEATWLSAYENSGKGAPDPKRLQRIATASLRAVEASSRNRELQFFLLVRSMALLETAGDEEAVADLLEGPTARLTELVRDSHPSIMGNHLLNLARYLRTAGRLTEAVEVLDEAVDWEPFVSRTWQSLLELERSILSLHRLDLASAEDHCANAEKVAHTLVVPALSQDLAVVRVRLSWYRAFVNGAVLPDPYPRLDPRWSTTPGRELERTRSEREHRRLGGFANAACDTPFPERTPSSESRPRDVAWLVRRADGTLARVQGSADQVPRLTADERATLLIP